MSARIREFDHGRQADAAAFRQLNEEWLTRHFVIEEDDRKVLADPVGQILASGGCIVFAEADGQTVGCCALIAQPDDPRTYEVAKLAVTAAFQGRRLGRLLMEAVLAKARSLGATRLVLVTNSGLKPALRLYESFQFAYLTPAQAGALGHYDRGDTFMELRLA